MGPGLTTRSLRIATRRSALAQWQACHVADLVACDTELVLTETSGDRDQAVPISEIGGKGVFVKEVQAALLDGRADLAVHSAKDLPAQTPDGLVFAAVPERGNPLDALVGSRLIDLPEGAVIATGSNRRRVELMALRPDLRFEQLRGNVQTRLEKAPQFDAIVMAATALERMELTPSVVEVLTADQMIPQVGQGALAIECRADDADAVALLAEIEHGPSRRCVDAERAFLTELGGDCSLPAGAFATLEGDHLHVRGMLADLAGTRRFTADARGDEPSIGAAVAADLRAQLEAPS